MPSLIKTAFLQLNKWAGNEYPKREDFVSDNEKIDVFASNVSSQMAHHAEQNANKAHGGVKYAVARLIGQQSIGNNSPTAVAWTSVFKNDYLVWNSNNPSRFTIPNGISKVKISTNTRWVANNTGTRRVEIRKNGANAYIGQAISEILASGLSQQYVSTSILEVVEGDYFEVYVTQASGSALNANGDGYSMWFCLEVME